MIYIYIDHHVNNFVTLEVTLTEATYLLELRFLYGQAEACLASHFPERYFYLLHE